MGERRARESRRRGPRTGDVTLEHKHKAGREGRAKTCVGDGGAPRKSGMSGSAVHYEMAPETPQARIQQSLEKERREQLREQTDRETDRETDRQQPSSIEAREKERALMSSLAPKTKQKTHPSSTDRPWQ